MIDRVLRPGERIWCSIQGDHVWVPSGWLPSQVCGAVMRVMQMTVERKVYRSDESFWAHSDNKQLWAVFREHAHETQEDAERDAALRALAGT